MSLNITVGETSFDIFGRRATTNDVSVYFDIFASYHMLWYFILCRKDIVVPLGALMGALSQISFNRQTLTFPLSTVWDAIGTGLLCWIGCAFVIDWVPFVLRGLVSILLILSIIFTKIPDMRRVSNYLFGKYHCDCCQQRVNSNLCHRHRKEE